jgi:hypothetical protein
MSNPHHRPWHYLALFALGVLSWFPIAACFKASKFQQAENAYQNGDCTTAIANFNHVINSKALDLDNYQTRAQSRKNECKAIQSTTKQQESDQESNDFNLKHDFDLVPINSRSQPISQNERNSESFAVDRKIAQASPLYGCWRLTFRNAAGVVHISTLVMNGYSGIMRTSYWNVLSRQTETVDQTMRIVSYASGILLAGYSPVWAGTSRRAGNYSPDNLLFSIGVDGQFTAANCANNLDCSPVSVNACPQ